jgi:hypothetical protein
MTDVELGLVIAPPPSASPPPTTSATFAEKACFVTTLIISMSLTGVILAATVTFFNTNWERVLGIDNANARLTLLVDESRNISSQLTSVSAQLASAQQQMTTLLALGTRLIGGLS